MELTFTKHGFSGKAYLFIMIIAFIAMNSHHINMSFRRILNASKKIGWYIFVQCTDMMYCINM